MEILERHIIGKRGAARCEDGITVTPWFAAVIDGSTSKSRLPELACGLSRGQVAMKAVDEVLRESPADLSIEGFCQAVTQHLRAQYARHYAEADILTHMASHPEDRFCCSAVVFSLQRREVWLVGDCHALAVADGRQHYLSNDKPCEAELAARRAAYLRQALEQGLSVEEVRHHDPGRDVILADLVASMRGQNIDYAVIDGFDIPMAFVRRYSLDALVGASACATDIEPASLRLILASDGYPRLFPTLAETEAYLQHCLRDDPLCIRLEPATKGWMAGTDSFDDRSYLSLRLPGASPS